MDIAYLIGTLLSGLAAVLAWLAKIYWSKEYIAAKDEVIKAKEAQIENLKAEVESYKELTPMKIREYFESVKNQLEEYNDLLQSKLDSTKRELEKKKKEIEKLESSDQKKSEKLNKVIKEKEDLESQTKELEDELQEVRKNEENFTSIKIPKLDTQFLNNMNQISNIKFNQKQFLDISKILNNSIQNFKIPKLKIPEEVKRSLEIISWFMENYEEVSNDNVSENEIVNIEKVIRKEFPDKKDSVIQGAVNYIERNSTKWKRIEDSE